MTDCADTNDGKARHRTAVARIDAPLDAWAVTGSIAAGKSSVLEALARRGFAVVDSDAIVAEMHRDPEWKARIAQAVGWPRDGQTDHRRPERLAAANHAPPPDRFDLREHLLAHPERFDVLERLLHPEVWARIRRWRAAQPSDRPCAVAVPLLFEAGWGRRFKRVMIVTAPAEQRRARALGRPGMTPEWFDAIAQRQWDDARRLAAATTLDAITIHNPDCGDRHALDREIDRQLTRHARQAASSWADQGHP